MKSSIILFILACLLLSFSIVQGQDVQTKGRFTNSVYAYEPPLLRGSDESETHVFLYQYLRFQAGIKEYNNLTFHLDTRVVNDLQEKIDDDLRFRLNRISLSARNLFSGLLDVELGRIFFHPGITFGSLDGGELVIKPLHNFQVQIYGGVESHLYHSYKFYDLDEALIYGGSLKYFNFYQTNVQLSYLEKKYAEETQWQVAGLNLSNYALNQWKFLLQTHYDLANSRLHRFYFSARFTPDKNWHFNLNLKQQHPMVYADSYYQMFDLKGYKKAAVGASYAISNTYSLSADYQLYLLDDGQGHRMIASISDLNGSAGVIFETGDLGDQLGFMINYGYEFMPDLIGSIAIDYTRYRFEEIYTYETALANALRLSYSFADHWKVDVEYQLLNNKFKDTDHRFLNHIHFIW